jgi:hypothetical protein
MRTPGASRLALLAATFLTACAGSGGSGGTGGGKPACVPPPPAQRTISFSGNIQPIFNRSCALAGCHAAGVLNGNLDLSQGQAYKQIYNVASFQMPSLKRVAPGKPTESYLVLKIQGAPGTIIGAPMPQGCPVPPPGGSCLGPDDLPAIQKWIEECATNN